MTSFSIIQKSQLEGAHRIDAEYYQPEYLDVKKSIINTKFSVSLLRDLISRPVVTGSTPQTRNPKADGTDILFIKTDTVRDGEIVIETADFLPIEQNIKNSEPKDGDILVTIIGATHDIVGRSAMVFPGFPKMNINQNIALIRPIKTILPAYLEAFLRGKYGREQLWQQSRQTEQVNLNCREVELIQIPIPPVSFQENIHLLTDASWKLLKQSKELFSQAESLLLDELGLKDGVIHEDLCYVVKLSDVKKAHRIDAEYFQPKYATLVEKLQKNNPRKLGNLVTMKKGFEPGSEEYREEGKLFIRVSSVSRFGITDKDQKYLSNELYSKLQKDYEPKVGEVLLTKDATPGVAYVVKEKIEGIISGGILRLHVKDDIEEEYLTLCISSQIGQMQAERDAGGSVISHWKPEQIGEILIPVLPTVTQQKLSNLVVQSHEARKKSKELLDEAKRRVEEMVEKNVN